MTMKDIKLGYEIGVGEEVIIKPNHLIVTGIWKVLVGELRLMS